MAGFEFQLTALDEASPVIQKLSRQLLEAAKKSDRFAKDVQVASKKADAALSKLPPKAKQAGQSFNSLSEAGKQLKSQIAALATVAAVTAFFKSSVEAAAAQERAVFRLNKTLQLNREYTRELSVGLQAWSQRMQEATGVADDQVLELFSLARAFTNSAEQARELTESAIDFSVGADLQVTEAVRRLGRAVRGSAADVANFAPEIRNLTKEQLAAGAATKLIGERFRGAAAELQLTFVGQVQQLRNELGDFQEEIGQAVIPGIVAMMPAARKVLETFKLMGSGIAAVGAQLVADFELKFGNAKDIAVSAFQAVKAAATLDFEEARRVVAESVGRMAERTREHAEKTKTIWTEFSNDVTAIMAQGGQEQVRVAESTAVRIDGVNKQLADKIKKRNEEMLQARRSVQDQIAALEIEGLERAGMAHEAELARIQQERDARLAALDEIARKAPETENLIQQARILALQNAALAEQEALERFDEISRQMEDIATNAANQISSAFAESITDSIMEGRKLQINYEQIFRQIARTAIQELIRIAIQAAITRAAVGAATSGAGAGGGGLIAGLLGGMQHGGIATKPIVAGIAEKEPEAVIPLSRLGPVLRGLGGGAGGGVNVTVHQHNTINATRIDDDAVRHILRRISLFTRTGAAEGAELVKSIQSRQGKVSGLSV